MKSIKMRLPRMGNPGKGAPDADYPSIISHRQSPSWIPQIVESSNRSRGRGHGCLTSGDNSCP